MTVRIAGHGPNGLRREAGRIRGMALVRAGDGEMLVVGSDAAGLFGGVCTATEAVGTPITLGPRTWLRVEIDVLADVATSELQQAVLRHRIALAAELAADLEAFRAAALEASRARAARSPDQDADFRFAGAWSRMQGTLALAAKAPTDPENAALVLLAFEQHAPEVTPLGFSLAPWNHDPSALVQAAAGFAATCALDLPLSWLRDTVAGSPLPR